ncbi:MAG: transporter substrate-binding protein [Paenibacillaceae bacterium]|nr:transporter substrate-binding protein [Paenibacillaceae bacterium]
MRRNIRNQASILCILALTLTMMASCGNPSASPGSDQAATADQGAKSAATSAQKQAEAPKEQAKPHDPVTVTMAMRASSMFNEEEFKRYLADPVSKKYPYITLNYIDIGQKGNSYPELIAAKNIPDIYTSHFPLTDFPALGVDYNMEELVKKHNFDLSRIQPEFIESAKIAANTDHLIAMPVYNLPYALLYNKAIFDKFAVPYPKDGMTWKDAQDLAVKLTRNVDGVQYYGMHPDSVFRGAYQLGLPFIDAVNDKAVFQTDGWKNLFILWSGLFKAQGMETTVNLMKGFTNGQIAMISATSFNLVPLLKVKDFDWDVTQYPTNPLAPGVGQRVDAGYMGITAQSKVKDEAFDVLTVLLSDEVQTDMSRNTRMSTLKNAQIQNQYGKAIDEKKNLVAFTKPKLSVLVSFKYNFNPNPAVMIFTAFNDVVNKGKDINTALREADEVMTKAIQEIKSR